MKTYMSPIVIRSALGGNSDSRASGISLAAPEADGLARFMGASPEPQVEVFAAGYRQKPSWPRTAQNSGGR